MYLPTILPQVPQKHELLPFFTTISLIIINLSLSPLPSHNSPQQQQQQDQILPHHLLHTSSSLLFVVLCWIVGKRERTDWLLNHHHYGKILAAVFSLGSRRISNSSRRSHRYWFYVGLSVCHIVKNTSSDCGFYRGCCCCYCCSNLPQSSYYSKTDC